MDPTDKKEDKECCASPSGQETAEQEGSKSCSMCGDCGMNKSPLEKMMGKGPKAMMQKMPEMCMAFMVVTPALLGMAVGLMIGRTTTRGR